MADSSAPAPRPVEIALLASVFVVAACGLLYELAAGTLAALAAASSAQAADLIPVNLDGANEGYNDNTPATPVGGRAAEDDAGRAMVAVSGMG